MPESIGTAFGTHHGNITVKVDPEGASFVIEWRTGQKLGLRIDKSEARNHYEGKAVEQFCAIVRDFIEKTNTLPPALPSDPPSTPK
jgi:hypothetical protein